MHKNSAGTVETFAGIHHKISQLPNSQTQHCIYRVHKQLRSVNTYAYEPKVIAIGPYHRDKDELRMMEEHKLRYMESLLGRRKQNLELYISAIGELEERARGCYAEPVLLSSSKFIEMLVVDGCFIVELIRKYNRKDPSCKKDPIFQMGWMMNSLQRDLMLFENQIPFFVLCRVYDLVEAPNQRNRLVYLLLFFCQTLYPGAVQQNRTDRDSGEIKHLLDLIHDYWRPTFGDSSDHGSVSVDIDVGRESRFIGSAKDLTNANVDFSNRMSNTLFEVNFEKGVMSMPTLTVEDRTECFFRNMIAYEQYFPTNGHNFVTDYVRLLDCLVNSSCDVDLLSQCDIINNWLGDSEVVAGIFNNLTESVTGLDKGFMYSAIFNRINKHSERPWNRVVAMLRRRYFGSPWAFVTFVSAALLLFLTVAQTVLSVVQLVLDKSMYDAYNSS